MANQFLIKETMDDMRDLLQDEIDALQAGTYVGVELLGYYQKGDTPAPIIYYLAPVNPDPGPGDGGSVVEVGDVKLEHKFVEEIVDIKYFGDDFIKCCNYCNRVNKIVGVSKDISIETTVKTMIPCPKGISSNNSTITINGGYHFNTDLLKDDLIIENVNFRVYGDQTSEEVTKSVDELFMHYSNITMISLRNLIVKNVDYYCEDTPADGSKRGRGFLDVRGFSKVLVTGVKISNVQYGIVIRQSNNGFIQNIEINNFDTAVFLDSMTNFTIDSSIARNTPEQSSHFMGKNSDQKVNGKDFVYATGDGITITNCKSFYTAERFCYIIAHNVVIDNNYARNGSGFKAVGSSKEVRKNVKITNNTLEIDENCVGKPAGVLVFSQAYYLENLTVRNNVMRAIWTPSIEDRQYLRAFIDINRNGKNYLIENNYAEINSAGFILYVCKTAKDITDDGQHIVENLRIINNTMTCMNWSPSCIISPYRPTGTDLARPQLKNVELIGNAVSIEEVNLDRRPKSLYSMALVGGLICSGNKLIKGSLPNHGFGDNFGAREKITLQDREIPVDNISGNVVYVNSLILEKASKFSFCNQNREVTCDYLSTSDTDQMLVSGKITISSNGTQDFSVPLGTREATVDYDAISGSYFKCSVKSGVFTDIIGIRNLSKINWTSTNINISKGGEDDACLINVH